MRSAPAPHWRWARSGRTRRAGRSRRRAVRRTRSCGAPSTARSGARSRPRERPVVSRGATATLQEQGRKLLTSFYGGLRALKLYPIENAAVQQALNELHEIMTGLLRTEGSVELRVVGDFFFLNETRLRLDLSNFSTFGSFAQSLSEHGIGAVDVTSGLTREEWAPFLSLLLRKGTGETAYDSFIERLGGTAVAHIDVRPEKDVHQPELEKEEAMQAAKRTYAQSVKVAKDVLGDMRMGRARSEERRVG